jgi:hypothetical protein
LYIDLIKLVFNERNEEIWKKYIYLSF